MPRRTSDQSLVAVDVQLSPVEHRGLAVGLQGLGDGRESVDRGRCHRLCVSSSPGSQCLVHDEDDSAEDDHGQHGQEGVDDQE